jgi:glycolate oxidase FAD binding subunit
VNEYRPESETELAEIVRAAAADGRGLRVIGGGTRDLGHAVEGDPLRTEGLAGIRLYEPGALTLVVGAGTPLAEVEAALAAEGQRLPFEPWEGRALYGTAGSPTIGGVVAVNASGPRRLQVGACRDSLIGVRLVDGTGAVVKSGGRVMKNVTGLDLVKLVCGSHGTLGVLSEVAFKVLPAPEAVVTLSFGGLSDEGRGGGDDRGDRDAVRGDGGGARAPGHRRRAGDAAPGRGLRRPGRLSRQALAEALRQFGTPRVTEGPGDWAWLRDAGAFAGRDGDVWRYSVKPSDGPTVGGGAAGDRAAGGRVLRLGRRPRLGAGARAHLRARGAEGARRACDADARRAPRPRRIWASSIPSRRRSPRSRPASAPGSIRTACSTPGAWPADGLAGRGGLMQTNFTAEQLSDPQMARSNEVLRTCVHCGFCTATCPTYQVLGDELDSPRGRIYLMKDMLEKGRPADAETVLHIDRCLSCLACMTTCPSGVHYMHLVDHAREYIERTYTRPLPERMLRWMLARCCPIRGGSGWR